MDVDSAKLTSIGLPAHEVAPRVSCRKQMEENTHEPIEKFCWVERKEGERNHHIMLGDCAPPFFLLPES